LEFYSLAFCRTLFGAGQAAIIAIGPSFIGKVTIEPVSAKRFSLDDVAPKERVTSWLAVLFLSVPCGYALGFAFGIATGNVRVERVIHIQCHTDGPLHLLLLREANQAEDGRQSR